jgi:hypothetical protein
MTDSRDGPSITDHLSLAFSLGSNTPEVLLFYGILFLTSFEICWADRPLWMTETSRRY